MKPKALIAWSSGKDSAWALHKTREAGEVEVIGALTTITENFDRVSMHGVRREILDAQLRAAGLSLLAVMIPSPCPNEIYEAKMATAMSEAKTERRHAHHLRRSVSRRHPRLSRGKAARHRHRAGLSAMAAADG